MSNIYQLTEHYVRFQNLLEDTWDNENLTEEDLELIVDTFDSINDSIEGKVENTIKFMKNIQGDIEAYKLEEDRLKKRRKTMENSVERLKNGIQMLLMATEIDKIKAGLFTASLRKNPPSVYIYDETKIPSEFREAQPDKIKNAEILKALKANASVDGATFAPEKKSLQIR